MTDNTKAITRTSSHAIERSTPIDSMTWEDMLRMGNELVRSGILPDHLRTGAAVAAVMLTGRELGMPPMRAARSLMLIKGKVVEDASSQLARFKADGGRATFTELDDKAATLHLRHPNGDEHTETFTLADAKAAGLLSNPTWQKFPRAMLRSRAITAGLKSVGWEGAVGAYDPDEARHFDDHDEREVPRVTIEATRAPTPEAPKPTRSAKQFVLDHCAAIDHCTTLDEFATLCESTHDDVERLPGKWASLCFAHEARTLAGFNGVAFEPDVGEVQALTTLDALRNPPVTTTTPAQPALVPDAVDTDRDGTPKATRTTAKGAA